MDFDIAYRAFLELPAGAQFFTVLIVAALICVPAVKITTFIRKMIWSRVDASDRHPVRLFPKSVSGPYYAFAGNRCEGSTLIFFRCDRQAGNADHWYPHSRGGYTTGSNLVVLCRTCNLSKSDKLPSVFQTRLVEHRRRNYYPNGVSTKIKGRSDSAPLLDYAQYRPVGR